MTDKKGEPPREGREGSEVLSSSDGSEEASSELRFPRPEGATSEPDQKSNTPDDARQFGTGPQRVGEEFRRRQLWRHRPLSSDDTEAMRQLVDFANQHFDGHLIILKFTTGWRVQLGTPLAFNHYGTVQEAHAVIEAMPFARTLAEAAEKAMAEARQNLPRRMK